MSTCEECGYFIPLSCMKGQCGFQDEPHETQQSICTWANETFGTSYTNAGVAARANQEMSELLMALARDDSFSGAPEEAADVMIVLMRVFERFGTTWQQEVDKKMAVNRGRTWKLDGSGHGYHVKTPLAEVVDAASKRFQERPLHRASIEAREEIRKSRETEASSGFHVRWSDEDSEWVGTCDRYPSLSFLDRRYSGALDGIRKVAHDVERDLARESFSEHLDKEP